MTDCEQRSDKGYLSLAELMDNAAQGLFKAVTKAAYKVSLKNGKSANSILILAGKGNNGGDGLVCARLLKEAGFDVSVLLVFGEPATDLSKAAYKRLDGVNIINGFDNKSLLRLPLADITVDCIFGTGFKGELRESVKPLFSFIRQSSAYMIACDIPSGCNADTGLCDELAIKADMTVTFHKPKLGMALSPTREHCGEVVVYDIGIEPECEETELYLYEPYERQIAEMLPSRPVGAHKGSFGRVLIIAGSENYYGAAAMAANAALRCGTGIVQLAAPKSVISALAGNMYECTYLPYDEGDGTDKLEAAVKAASAVLIGCGMGVSEHTRQTLDYVIKNAECPLIIDADGLNCLAENTDMLTCREGETILTPHIGELARLCGVDRDTAANERPTLAKELTRKYGAVVAAKSAGTLISGKNGYMFISNYGNTALSKGGSGDMLAGMTASFAAQQAAPTDAALLGCYVLGRSAEILCADMSERGVLARDILTQIPKTLKQLEGQVR